ncbi:Protein DETOXIFICATION 45, chloroplastic [Linum perenne]
MDRRRYLPPLFLLLVTLSFLSTSPTTAATFKCNTTSKCYSLIDYISPQNTTTTFAAVQTLFAIRNLRSLLGANNLPLTTPPNQTIPPKQSLRIRFPCICRRGGAGLSNKLPVYTVKKGDGLFDIASKVFAGVVTADEIAAVNNVTDKDLIQVGQRLWIPLPCSCDDVDGGKVVHYGHVVEPGSSIDGIAARFGSSVEVLMGVNGLKNGSGLLVGQVLDVPLRACNSSISSNSEDSQMLLANGTYAFTAHNCVRCNCDASNNWTLQCQPSGIKPSDWSTCPAMQCGGGDNIVMLGNSTGSDCGGSTCSYAGFSSNQTIFTSLDSNCPASPSGSPPNGNSGGRIDAGSSRWWKMGLFGNLFNLKVIRVYHPHDQTAVGFGWRDGSTRNYLSAEYRDQLSPLVTRRRKHDSEVVYNQSASGYGVESAADAEESLELVEGDVVNGSAHEKLDSVGVPVEKKPNFKRELTMLTLPAIAGQAIDPFAQLMETGFIGGIGSVELASAGVATMIFNNISKLFNIPLFSVATSFVAEDIAKNAVIDSTAVKAAEEGHTNGALVDKVVKRKQLASVSTALLLATGIGILEATMLSFGCGPFLNLMGVTQGTQMRIPAEKFLSIKALGAPALVLSLTLQGIFRGFKDPSTPVLCLGNLSAVFLFPLLMYRLNLGVAGAAIATVVSQYLVTLLMLWQLNKKVVLLPPRIADLQFGVYLKSGGFLIGRTLAVLITMTLATAMAARQGTMAMAGHQICMQVWLAVSLLTDALASSAQVGLFTGLTLATILALSFDSIAKLFTTDAELLHVVKTGVLFVCASQPLNALAYIFDGLHYGVSDFRYAACSMMMVGAISSLFLLYVPGILGLPGVWSGLALFMALRTGAGIARLMQKSGPWWFLHKDSQKYQVG